MEHEKKTVLILSVLTIALLFTSSISGIASDKGGNPYSYTSVSGENVEIYGGTGIYRYDNPYKAVGFQSFDWVNLIIVLPLFVLGIFQYWRRTLLGRMLLASLFTYVAWIYLLGVMGNTFNAMFLVWTALFSIGLFGLIIVLMNMDVSNVGEKLASNYPRKTISVYVLIVGSILLIQYLTEIIAAYAAGKPPSSLDHYTTLELASLEMGIMIPLHVIGAILLWRRKAWGYVIATILVFISSAVFVALSISLILFHFGFGRGDLLDMGITFAIAMVANAFTVLIFKRINE